MQEYHDGMLLFELMKKEVWDKATEDTIGLKKYYEENKNVYNNQTEFDISVFEYKDDNVRISAEKLLLDERELYPDSVLVTKICENNNDAFRLIENGAYTKGQNIYADIIFKMDENNELQSNQKIIKRDNEKILIFINNKRISKSKDFDEIKGVVIADYQNYLEEKWMEKLTSKYPIKIFKKELKKLKAECNQ
jgi:peptidyl-prolyl cis-trans isomerase SurA